jgi:hypothetical protein
MPRPARNKGASYSGSWVGTASVVRSSMPRSAASRARWRRPLVADLGRFVGPARLPRSAAHPIPHVVAAERARQATAATTSVTATTRCLTGICPYGDEDAQGWLAGNLVALVGHHVLLPSLREPGPDPATASSSAWEPEEPKEPKGRGTPDAGLTDDELAPYPDGELVADHRGLR